MVVEALIGSNLRGRHFEEGPMLSKERNTVCPLNDEQQGKCVKLILRVENLKQRLNHGAVFEIVKLSKKLIIFRSIQGDMKFTRTVCSPHG